MKVDKDTRQKLYLSHVELKRIYEKVQGLIDDLPECIPEINVSEFAEQHRVLPRGTPYPGPWLNKRTPYLVDIMNDLSASSPVREVVFAKSAQVGATSTIENWIAYIIKAVPGPTLFCTANLQLLNKWVNKRLNPLLMSCGLESKIFAQYKMKGQRRTGNQAFSKEFPGGSLDMATAGAAAGLRMDSIRYLSMDEVDGYKDEIDGEGDPISIARARTKAWEGRSKIFFSSTPTTIEDTHIWRLYEEGDQRRFMVPCPHCKKLQFLEFGDEDSKFGLKWETKNGRLDPSTIYYECRECHEPILEKSKYSMLQKGYWEPTAISQVEGRHSYHISAIYSLMEKWKNIVSDHINSQEDPLKRRAHMNLNLGLPFKEIGQRPSIEKVLTLTGDYKEGTIPDGVLFLTMAVDVQQGSKRSKVNPPRLELEVCGHGYPYKTWSINYKVFEGSIKDPYGGAWEKMNQWAEEGGLQFTRSDGIVFSPRLTFIDSSDGVTESIVFDFCQQWGNTFPIKGARQLKMDKDKMTDEELDEASYRDGDRFRANKKSDITYYMISTNWYKKKIYRNLATSIKYRQNMGDTTPPGFCDFPREYKKRYFEMLTAEELRKDGSFWKATGKRNEALDLRVYNLCAAEIWLKSELERVRGNARRNLGATKEQCEIRFQIRDVIERLIKATARKSVA
jgi:phage terminase large subunit GpA-like protein